MCPTLGQTYSRQQIFTMFGGSMVSFLPLVDNAVVCGCFKREPRWNPDAPEKVVFGPGPKVRHAAERVAQQSEPIPVFIFRSDASWEFMGMYQCNNFQTDRAVCEREEKANPARGTICGILSFRRSD